MMQTTLGEDKKEITEKDGELQKMKENIDINAGTIIHKDSTVDVVGREIFDLVLDAASGKKVKAEILGHDELFCVTRAIVPDCLVGSLSFLPDSRKIGNRKNG